MHHSAKIGKDCKIGPNVSIGIGCELENGVRVSNAVLLHRVKVCLFLLVALLDRAEEPARSCRCCAVLVVALAAAVLDWPHVTKKVESGDDAPEHWGALLSLKNPIPSGETGAFVAAL